MLHHMKCSCAAHTGCPQRYTVLSRARTHPFGEFVSELKEWYIQPLPPMTASNKVLDDDDDGNEAEQQPWLQAPHGLLPSQAVKSPSAAGNRLRSAVKSIAAVRLLSL
jgi:hypothetical protein